MSVEIVSVPAVEDIELSWIPGYIARNDVVTLRTRPW
jgi:hypothetical protein